MGFTNRSNGDGVGRTRPGHLLNRLLAKWVGRAELIHRATMLMLYE